MKIVYAMIAAFLVMTLLLGCTANVAAPTKTTGQNGLPPKAPTGEKNNQPAPVQNTVPPATQPPAPATDATMDTEALDQLSNDIASNDVADNTTDDDLSTAYDG